MHMEKKNTIEKIAAAFRGDLEKAWQRTSAPGGICVPVSELLCARLQTEGYDAEIVKGWLLLEGDEDDQIVEHHWVEVDGQVVDLTLDQIDGLPHRVFVAEEHPIPYVRCSHSEQTLKEALLESGWKNLAR
jgi:hypothetical protein